MGMKTKLKIAGLDQSVGTGLSACLHNSADGKSCMHIIKYAQLHTTLSPFYRFHSVPFAGR